jgi:hypothetical protein
VPAVWGEEMDRLSHALRDARGFTLVEVYDRW